MWKSYLMLVIQLLAVTYASIDLTKNQNNIMALASASISISRKPISMAGVLANELLTRKPGLTPPATFTVEVDQKREALIASLARQGEDAIRTEAGPRSQTTDIRNKMMVVILLGAIGSCLIITVLWVLRRWISAIRSVHDIASTSELKQTKTYPVSLEEK